MAGSSLFKGVIQVGSLIRFCQGSVMREVNPVSFPRERLETAWGEKWGGLKNETHGRELVNTGAVLVEIQNGSGKK